MKNGKDGLGDRMKNYENITNYYLIKRMPVVVRLDMCHGHTFTKGFAKPYDSVFMKSMQETMLSLCEKIQGCVFGYTQSDEITLILVDYQTYETSAWFDNRVQKICSVSASMASQAFNRAFERNAELWFKACRDGQGTAEQDGDDGYRLPNGRVLSDSETVRLYKCYKRSLETGAVFDSRAFNVPKEDVANCVIWRQKDAERNSIQSLAQSMYRHKALMGISCRELQEKMRSEKDVDWDSLETQYKRGVSCIRDREGKWFIDYDMPVLTQNRGYIEDLIYFEDP